MLLMIGTKPTIVGAAPMRLTLERKRPVAWLQPVALTLPVRKVVGDERLLHAVLATTFQEVDAIVLGDDLRRDEREAGLTQAAGLAEEQIGRALADRRLAQR